MTVKKPKLALCYDRRLYRDAFRDVDWRRLAEVADIVERAPLMSYVDERATALLPEVEVLITGWDAPLLDEAGLANLPRLKMISHLGATVKAHHASAVWRRGVRVSSAVEATAYPVIEFTIAAIVFSGKHVLARSRKYCTTRAFPHPDDEFDIGLMGQTIGIVGASRVGLPVIERLRDFDVEVLVYDPFLSREHARGLGAEKVDELDELVVRSNIVSIHAPVTDQTINMFDAARLAKLRDGATLINTARGVLVDQEALIAELERGRISAVIDVTHPEPLPADSPLFTLPNVLLTPHMAGPMGLERSRMFASVVDEVGRFCSGRSLRGEISLESLGRIG
ncbi:MAG: hydroxyacid dehydrogenase [Devosia sp.]|nr:hydroxyacid dehydrogenase [Devosia sp.]